ncbi:MAG: NAD-dependent epimerase/dehydratase family protein [Pseudomonadota bacterium]
MRVLITGSSGFVGRALLDVLAQRDGITPVAGQRTDSARADGIPTLAYGDLTAPGAWDDVSLAGFDAVVHAAGSAHSQPQSPEAQTVFRAVNEAATRGLAERCADHDVAHLVHLSSIGVLGAPSPGEVFSDQSATQPREFYAQTKLAGERAIYDALADRATVATVLRPTMIYGDGQPGNPARLEKLVRRLPIVPLGGIRNQRSFVYVGNLAHLVADMLQRRPAQSRSYVVADPWVRSTADFVRKLAELHGVPKRVWNIPPGVLRTAAGLLGKGEMARKLMDDFRIDPGPVWSDFDAAPAFDWDASFRHMAAQASRHS